MVEGIPVAAYRKEDMQANADEFPEPLTRYRDKNTKEWQEDVGCIAVRSEVGAIYHTFAVVNPSTCLCPRDAHVLDWNRRDTTVSESIKYAMSGLRRLK